MSLVLLLIRMVLAAVFLVAGIAKLADRAGSRQALRDFGVPASLTRPSSILLPLVELAVAVALLFPALTWWGAIGALALLLLFIIGISYNLAYGRAPNCHCFGQIHATPAGWPTLTRNLVLAAGAGIVVGFGRAAPMLNPLAWFGLLTGFQRIGLFVGVVLLGLVILEGWGLLLTIQQQGRFLLRIEELEKQLISGDAAHKSHPTEGLPVGMLAPSFHLTMLVSSNQDVETGTLEELRARGKPVVLLFSDPDCGPCNSLLPKAARWQRNYADRLTLAFISRGTIEANREKAGKYGITRLFLQKDREVAQAYQIDGTPGAVLVSSNGNIGSSAALGADDIEALIIRIGEPPMKPLLPLVSLSHGREESR